MPSLCKDADTIGGLACAPSTQAKAPLADITNKVTRAQNSLTLPRHKDECNKASPACSINSSTIGAAHVVLEGNICAGKSTLCAMLKDQLTETDVRVQKEMTEDAFLAAFYSDMKKWGFAFQMFMFSTRQFQVEEGARLAAKHDALVLTDRGIIGDWCFARKNWLDGNLTETEYEIYQDVASKRALCKLPEKVDCTVYLDVDPEQCCYRMKHMRKTAAEMGVLRQYVTGIDDMYFEAMLQLLSQGGKALILRSDSFVEAADVQLRLRDTLSGRLPCAIVEFTTELEAQAQAHKMNRAGAVCKWIDTEAEIHEAFEDLHTDPYDPECLVDQQHVFIRYEMCEAAPDADSQSSRVSYMSAKTNEYKRTVMHFLSMGCVVVFYSQDEDEI
jgi:deoxyadenosine/deoxycytidine kinase